MTLRPSRHRCKHPTAILHRNGNAFAADAEKAFRSGTGPKIPYVMRSLRPAFRRAENALHRRRASRNWDCRGRSRPRPRWRMKSHNVPTRVACGASLRASTPARPDRMRRCSDSRRKAPSESPHCPAGSASRIRRSSYWGRNNPHWAIVQRGASAPPRATGGFS